MSSSPDDPDRGQGKGRSRNDGDDPESEFEDAADSDAVDDAQQTVNEIEQQIEANEGSAEVDVDSTETFTASNLQSDAVASELADRLSDDTGEQNSTQIQQLGADDLTPDAADNVNIDNATEFTPLGDTDNSTGGSSESMWVATTDDGDEMFVTLENDASAGDPVEGTAIANELNRSLSDDAQQNVKFPDMNADGERNAAVLEAVGADDSRAAGQYAPFNTDAEFSKDDYLSSMAAKLLIGDRDMSGNIMASSDGNFHPIDFDLAGSDINDMAKRSDGSVFDKYGTRANNLTALYDFDVSSDDLRQATTELANQVDVDSLESNLKSNPNILKRQRQTIVSNVKAIQDGEL